MCLCEIRSIWTLDMIHSKSMVQLSFCTSLSNAIPWYHQISPMETSIDKHTSKWLYTLVFRIRSIPRLWWTLVHLPRAHSNVVFCHRLTQLFPHHIYVELCHAIVSSEGFPRSPDLTPLHFVLWGYLKKKSLREMTPSPSHSSAKQRLSGELKSAKNHSASAILCNQCQPGKASS